ncbi:MAG: LEA type 2 family protein [Woeseiaceae bacterium]|nr:LEA type 2 family protein [Woeseiaceae bacterium]
MNPLKRYAAALTVAMLAVLGGCAGSESMIRSPDVDLTHVKVTELGFSNQSFELGFDVHNPNPFPLPVRGIRYTVHLNDHRFAGGESHGAVTVPASGDESFVIEVDLDLLRSGAELTSVLRSGFRDAVNYELYGKLDLDLPTTPSLGFSSRGTILVQNLH